MSESRPKIIKYRSRVTHDETRRRNNEIKSLIRMVIWPPVTWAKWKYNYQSYDKIAICELMRPTKIRYNNQSSTLNRASKAVSPPARLLSLSIKVTRSINRKNRAVATLSQTHIKYPPPVSLSTTLPPSRNPTDLSLLPNSSETKGY